MNDDLFITKIFSHGGGWWRIGCQISAPASELRHSMNNENAQNTGDSSLFGAEFREIRALLNEVCICPSSQWVPWSLECHVVHGVNAVETVPVSR